MAIIFGNRIRSVYQKSRVEEAKPKPAFPVISRTRRSALPVPVIREEVLGVKYDRFRDLPSEVCNHVVNAFEDCFKVLCTGLNGAYASGLDGQLDDLLDKQIPESVYQLGRELMATVLQRERGFFGTVLRCDRCEKASLQYENEPQRTIVTRLGDVKIRRAYYRCACGHSVFPLDTLLGVDGEHSMLPAIQEAVALMASKVPYGEAVETIQKLSPVRLCQATAERVTMTVASHLQEEQERERQQAFSNPAQAAFPTSSPVETSAVAIVAGDGGMCKIRQQKEYREFKMGVLGWLHPTPNAKERAIIEGKSYVAHIANVDTLFEHLAVEYHRIGLQQCHRVHFVADGADCYWNRFDFLADHNQTISRVLDFYHACEHLTAAKVAVFEDNPMGNVWFESMRTRLWESRLGSFFKEFTRQHRRAIDAHQHEKAEAIHSELNYFRERRRLLRYKECREQGLPIGSGMVEGGIRFIGKDRLDRTGMKWSVPGAEAILQLRCLDASMRWEGYFKKRSTTRMSSYYRTKTAWLRAS